ncbi:MAG: AI-2E family transporter [Candidatus Binatia bacterium]
MTQEQLFAAFFFAVFLFLLYQLYLFLAGFFAPLVWAAILALTFYPLTTRLARWLRGSRGATAGLLVLAVTVGAVMPSIYLGSILVGQATAAYAQVEQAVREGSVTSLLASLRGSRLGALWTLAAPWMDRIAVDPSDLLLRATNWVSSQIVGQATGLARNVLVTVLDLVIMLVALFFFFRDGDRMAAAIRRLIPMQEEHTDAVLHRLADTLTAVVQSLVVTAVTQGLLAGLGYWLIGGISVSVFLGFLTGLAAFLPLAGPAFVWSGVAAYLAMSGATGRALGLVLWGVLVVSTVDNFIKPIFIGGRARLPTFLLLISLLGGVREYGFLGVFLGPVVLATLLAFVDIYRDAYRLVTARR